MASSCFAMKDVADLGVGALSVRREGRCCGAFEVDDGEVVEVETDGLFGCVGYHFFSMVHQ